MRDVGESRMPEAEQWGLLLELSEALPGPWTVAGDRHANPGRWELHEHEGIQLRVQLGPALVAASGIHEAGGRSAWDYGLARPAIRFSLAKTPAQMAAEIVRRLLPAVRDDARRLATALRRRELLYTGRLRTLLSARRLLDGAGPHGLSWPDGPHGGRAPGYGRAGAHDLAGLSVAVEFTEEIRGDLGAVTVSRLTHAELLTVIETIAALTGARETTG